MTAFDSLKETLKSRSDKWLVSGAAGFIGSNLVEFLLRAEQRVVGLDNFATGHRHNLQQVKELVGDKNWGNFRFVEGDIRVYEDCLMAAEGIDRILHQGALGSVPRSIEDPLSSHDANVTGMIHMLQAAKEQGVSQFVYASSSSVYGDSPKLPKVESEIGESLSPYAATKLVDEIYAAVFCRCYGMKAVGLRYFNVFGPRQDPNGAYAAVIPKWIASLLDGEDVFINGDGETSRDFCHVNNVIQANLLSATRPMEKGSHAVYNIAVGERTTLNQLYELIRNSLQLQEGCSSVAGAKPVYRAFRDGDVQHSLADISAARAGIGFAPTHDVNQGMEETIAWYVADHKRRNASG